MLLQRCFFPQNVTNNYSKVDIPCSPSGMMIQQLWRNVHYRIWIRQQMKGVLVSHLFESCSKKVRARHPANFVKTCHLGTVQKRYLQTLFSNIVQVLNEPSCVVIQSSVKSGYTFPTSTFVVDSYDRVLIAYVNPSRLNSTVMCLLRLHMNVVRFR